MTERTLAETVELLEGLVKRRREKRLEFFEPYEKQREFIAAGLTVRERCLMAGNQLGKTYCGAFEMACHLTGEYPAWWVGRRFVHPVKAWACGVSSTVVRDVLQRLLVGPPTVEADWGTGFIPKDLLVGTTRARGVADALDSVTVTHKTKGKADGNSILMFKSYEQGREKFQSDTIHVGWCDEEPEYSIYSEILTRTNATGGMVYMTFTPLKGASRTVLRFTDEPSKDRVYVVMTIDDVGHISADEKATIIASYQPYEREARVYGTPMLGEGRVFPYSEEQITEPTMEIVPDHWTKLWGIDFGIQHPFAAVLIGWDKDADVIHVLHTIRMADALPLQHAQPMKALAANVPVAWPADGHERRDDGQEFHIHYKRHGLLMLPSHATWEDGGVSTEAGILEMSERYSTGKLKVANHLRQYLEEHSHYHRKKGLLVKERDDIMSATRIAIMQKRSGKPGPIGSKVASRRVVTMARDIDFNLFTGGE